MKKLLHVGCGGDPAPVELFRNFSQVRLDINPEMKPDVVADMRAIPFPAGSFDGLYCAHALEHLPEKDADACVVEWRRVVRDGGFAMTILPDLQAACAHIAKGLEKEPFYQAHSGDPIYAQDVIFGHRASCETNPFMYHRTGFTPTRLYDCFVAAGFASVDVGTDGFNLWAVGK